MDSLRSTHIFDQEIEEARGKAHRELMDWFEVGLVYLWLTRGWGWRLTGGVGCGRIGDETGEADNADDGDAVFLFAVSVCV